MTKPPRRDDNDVRHVVNQWFRALDQQPIRVGVRTWWVQVLGVHVHERDVWVQIGHGTSGPGVLLHVSASTPVEQAVRALAQVHNLETLAAHQLLVVTVGQAEPRVLTFAEP